MKVFIAVSFTLIFMTWPIMVGWALGQFFDSDFWFMAGLISASAIEGVLINNHEKWAKPGDD